MDNLKDYFLEHNDMIGWYDAASINSEDTINDIKTTSEYIRNNCDVFLVLGIGGSYMGSLSIIKALNPYFHNKTKKPEIYFLGTSLSSEYISNLITLINDKRIILNVISKSGETFEIDTSYEIIMKFMKEKYSVEELQKRVIVQTDEKGKL